MTKVEKLALMKNRYNTLAERGDKNIKAPGVLKGLKREIRSLETQIRCENP